MSSDSQELCAMLLKLQDVHSFNKELRSGGLPPKVQISMATGQHISTLDHPHLASCPVLWLHMETNKPKQLSSLCSIPDRSLQSHFKSSAQLS